MFRVEVGVARKRTFTVKSRKRSANVKHYSPVTGNADSRQIAKKKLLLRLKTNQTINAQPISNSFV
jgi:hypothetical protein